MKQLAKFLELKGIPFQSIEQIESTVQIDDHPDVIYYVTNERNEQSAKWLVKSIPLDRIVEIKVFPLIMTHFVGLTTTAHRSVFIHV